MNTMFDYEPFSEAKVIELRYQLLPDGYYDGTIIKCINKISSTGNPMLDLTVDVYDKNGQPFPVKDFTTLTSKMAWKFRHLCQSAGLLKEYEDKTFIPSMLDHKNVRVFIKTQLGSEIPEDKLNGQPHGTCYPPKNVINDYLVREENAVYSAKNKDEFNDDIPW